jgi:hypothetical protein
MQLAETRYKDENWIPLAHNIIQWWDVVNMVINLQISLKVRLHQIAGQTFS